MFDARVYFKAVTLCSVKLNGILLLSLAIIFGGCVDKDNSLNTSHC